MTGPFPFFAKLKFPSPSLPAVIQLLFFLLLNTLLYNYRFDIGLSFFLSDLLVLALLILTMLEWKGLCAARRVRPWLVLFAILLAYYLILAGYARFMLGSSLHHVLGGFRYLLFYLLTFFAGLYFTTSMADMVRITRYIRIHLVLAIVPGVLSLWFPALNPASIYLDGKLSPPLYFMVVGVETALLGGLVFVQELLALAARRHATWFSLVFLLAALVGILGSQNRGVLAAVLLMTGLVFGYGLKADRPVKKRLLTCLGLAMLVTAGLCLALLFSPAYEKFKGRVEATIAFFKGEEPFFRTIPGVRIGRNVVIFKEWLKSPVIGCGWGQEIKEYRISDWQGKHVKVCSGTPHNYFITILYRNGVIGFVLMMAILGLIFRRLKPNRPMDRENGLEYTLFIFYIGVLLFSAANTQLYSHPVFIPVVFFLFGAGVSHASLHRTSENQRLPETALAAQPARPAAHRAEESLLEGRRGENADPV